MAQPMRIAICCIILMPVCRACHDFLLRQTALRKGSSEGMPRAEATTANALYAKHSNAVILDIAKIDSFNQYITNVLLKSVHTKHVGLAYQLYHSKKPLLH